MLNGLEIFLVTFALLQDFSQSLRLVEVRIPNYVIKGSTAQLECLYDLDGEALYSVKWYKDGNEFYRYVPRDMPPAQTFLLPGVSVDVHNSSDAIVTLREVNLQSAGRFRCEVSGEAPSFQTVTEHGDMVVVSLPDQGPPKITGGRPRYQIGDWVRINCTAGRSKPAVQLSWFVNGEAAEPHTLRKYDTIISGREGLETTVLGLQFRVEQQHFRNSDMKLKCVASLSTFYWRSNEESVEGDRPQKAPVLESRETVYASNSRADPVQANNKTDSTASIKPATIILLLAMALITTTSSYLEELYLKNVLRIVRKQSSGHCNSKNTDTNRDKGCDKKHEKKQRQESEPEALDTITNKKLMLYFNKEVSNESVILLATAKPTLNTKPQTASISAVVPQLKTISETVISSKTTRTLRTLSSSAALSMPSSSASPFACCPYVSTKKHNVTCFKSR